ncbi:MAG TPA: lysylphosphatidylglycerol synthase transmembrane domain-containing protein, partial [Dehalococcoidia bacterium]|nr:lysylphosphatidylglycerol synthase transmembrane domain-containing protein [Dehalococcoidia bacterium]
MTLAVTVTHLHELRQIADTLSHARPAYVVGAVLLQAAFLANLALFYHSSFAATGLKAPLGRFVLLGIAGYFVNLVSKTGGLGGVAPYLSEGSQRGFPSGRVITAYMVTVILGHAAFLSTLATALVFLYSRGSLNDEEIIASAVIFTLLLVIFVLLLATVSSRARLERLYRWLGSLGDRVLGLVSRRPVSDEEAVGASAGELYDAVEHVRGHLSSYGRPFLHAVLVEVLSIGVLFLTAQALDAHIGIATAVAAYALSVLFAMIAVTPAGLGFVEASLAVLFISFG